MYVDIANGRKRAYIIRLCLLAAIVLCVAAKPAPRRIDLDVRDADLHNVLRLLADTGRTNIVVGDHIKGRVTVKLRRVPWTRALDVVLRAQGLGVERSGNVLFVDTLENLTKADQNRAQRRAAKVELAPLVTRLIPLSYAKAEDLAPLVKSMLTDRGRVSVDRRTNVLIVTDVETRVSDVERRVRPPSGAPDEAVGL